MSLSRVGLSALRGVRHRSSAASNVHPGYSKTGPLKDKYSLEDDTPVFTRGGTVDRIIYVGTLIGCIVGIGFATDVFIYLGRR